MNFSKNGFKKAKKGISILIFSWSSALWAEDKPSTFYDDLWSKAVLFENKDNPSGASAPIIKFDVESILPPFEDISTGV